MANKQVMGRGTDLTRPRSSSAHLGTRGYLHLVVRDINISALNTCTASLYPVQLALLLCFFAFSLTRGNILKGAPTNVV